MRRDALTVVLGASMGQLITVACTPILTRLYSADELGAYSYIQALIITVGMALALRFDYAIVLQKSLNRKKILSVAVLILIITLSTISIICMVILARLRVLSIQLSITTLMILWLGLIAYGLQELARNIALAVRDYSSIARLGGGRALLQAVWQTLGGVVSPGAVMLVSGYVLSNLVSCVPFLLRLYLRNLRTRGGLVRIKRIISLQWGLLKDNKHCPLVLLPGALVNTLCLYIPTVVVVELYSTAEGAYFSMAQRLLGLPMMFFGKAVSDYFFAEFSANVAKNNGVAKKLFLRIILVMSCIACVFIFAAKIVSPDTLAILLGEEWRESYAIIASLVPLYCLQLVALPCAQALVVLRRFSVMLAIDSARLVGLLCLTLFVAKSGWQVIAFVKTYAAITAIAYGILICNCFHFVSKRTATANL